MKKLYTSSIKRFLQLALVVLLHQGYLVTRGAATTTSNLELNPPSQPSISLAFVTPSYSYSRSRITKLRRISRTRINSKFIAGHSSTEQQQHVTTGHILASSIQSASYRRSNNTKIIRRNRTTVSTASTSTTTTSGLFFVNRGNEDFGMKNSFVVSSIAPSTTRLDEPRKTQEDALDDQEFHYAANNRSSNHHHHHSQHQHVHWNSTNQKHASAGSHKNVHDISAPNVNLLEGDYMNYLSNGSLTPHIPSAGDKEEPEDSNKRYWAFILFIFPFFTIFGNLLVVLSVVKENNLHTVTNYFIVSLAISDLTVAAGDMPFSVYYEVRPPPDQSTTQSID